jgi:hypothetical protein
VAAVRLEAVASSISVKVNTSSPSGSNRPLVEFTNDGEDVSQDEDEDEVFVVIAFSTGPNWNDYTKGFSAMNASKLIITIRVGIPMRLSSAAGIIPIKERFFLLRVMPKVSHLQILFKEK